MFGSESAGLRAARRGGSGAGFFLRGVADWVSDADEPADEVESDDGDALRRGGGGLESSFIMARKPGEPQTAAAAIDARNRM